MRRQNKILSTVGKNACFFPKVFAWKCRYGANGGDISGHMSHSSIISKFWRVLWAGYYFFWELAFVFCFG